MATVESVEILAPVDDRGREVLSREALEFVTKLQREFNARRRELLAKREERQRAISRGERPDFLPETRSIRDGEWQVAPVPPDLQDRRVEITGPVERKMMINALNSGARVFMADFEDANSPTWDNVLAGQQNLVDAIERRLTFTSPEGKDYRLNEKVAVLMVRPRGWHLWEKHVTIDGEPASASLFDFGLYFFHNARRLLEKRSGPYFYLPKLESHLEARLWNDVFNFAEDELGIAHGSIKATVLIETILAAFEMEEILYELRDHSAGLNAGRWDYIFSIIKKFQDDRQFVLPDRSQITMTVPFMRAYTELLVRTCHRHGAHAIGGMAAFVPSRKDAEVNETALGKVREDKERESKDGFDGTWVAHPDLVPVATEVFDGVLTSRANQVDRRRDDVSVSAKDLLDFRVPGGQVTEAGLRNNVSVGIQYLEAWLRGNGAVAIYNLMEDAATSEISRGQVWQWAHHGVELEDGRSVDRELIAQIADEELAKVREQFGAETYDKGTFPEAKRLFLQVALEAPMVPFLTIPAYESLP